MGPLGKPASRCWSPVNPSTSPSLPSRSAPVSAPKPGFPLSPPPQSPALAGKADGRGRRTPRLRLRPGARRGPPRAPYLQRGEQRAQRQQPGQRAAPPGARGHGAVQAGWAPRLCRLRAPAARPPSARPAAPRRAPPRRLSLAAARPAPPSGHLGPRRALQVVPERVSLPAARSAPAGAGRARPECSRRSVPPRVPAPAARLLGGSGRTSPALGIPGGAARWWPPKTFRGPSSCTPGLEGWLPSRTGLPKVDAPPRSNRGGPA